MRAPVQGRTGTRSTLRPAKLTPFQPGDRITLKKPHPCGGLEWEVYRIGADIGLKCRTCGRRFMLARRELERRMKARVPAKPAPPSAEAGSR